MGLEIKACFTEKSEADALAIKREIAAKKMETLKKRTDLIKINFNNPGKVVQGLFEYIL